MSIASGDTERSALESKDRQQLATIARALGGNPTARTRKDELVELILGLADEGAGAPTRNGDTMSDQTTEDATAASDSNGSDGGGGDTAVAGERADRPARAEKADRDDGRAEKAETSDRDDDRADKPERSELGRTRTDRHTRADRDAGADTARRHDPNRSRCSPARPHADRGARRVVACG